MSAIDKRIRIMLWGVAIVVIVGGVFPAVRLWNLDWPVLMAILSVFGIMIIIAAVGWWLNRPSKTERITRNILKRLEEAAASRRARGRSADGGGGGVVLSGRSRLPKVTWTLSLRTVSCIVRVLPHRSQKPRSASEEDR